MALRNPIGARTIVAVPLSVAAQSFDLTTRLHQPITTAASLPVGAEASRATSTPGWAWTLYYTAPGAGGLFLLLSTPASGHDIPNVHGPRVRDQFSVTPCAAIICWVEGGVHYAIAAPPYNGIQPPSARQALTLAHALVSGP